MSSNSDVSSNDLKMRINQDFVSITIEKILMDISPDTYHKVMDVLNKKQHYPIYDHPESIKKILKDLFGESYTEIINKIKIELERHVVDKEISRFISNLDE
ncbi:MAG TPA: hypothetical protein VLD64_04355 [Nitrosarchaeum sp.]|nr:hypothetical protein [Nitrosarchaeum sp.]